jgi:hypothetical protein
MVNRVAVNRLPYPLPDPTVTQVTGSTVLADRPIPVDLVYQVTSVSRSARHDRQLQRFLWHKFPGKWGALWVPADDTARTMQLEGWTSAVDVEAQGRRTFRRMYTVSVASELWASKIVQVANVTSVDFTVHAIGAGINIDIGALNCSGEPGAPLGPTP